MNCSTNGCRGYPPGCFGPDTTGATGLEFGSLNDGAAWLNEARQVLGDVYGWFTEGFDTADLQDAKMLLDALA